MFDASESVPSRDEILALVDPEVAPAAADTLPPLIGSDPLDPLEIRALDERRSAEKEPVRPVNPAPGVVEIDRGDGSLLALRIHRPALGAALGTVLWIHGGGMFLGSASGDDAACRDWADATGMAVVAVDYRLAPEHPYPAPIEDCFSALQWIADGSDSALDSERIILFGASAGGGLATGLALLARDRGVRAIRLVQAIHPMLDNREVTGSARRLRDAPVWNARLNRVGWKAYLGSLTEPTPYAVPALADDLSGLPAFYIDTAEFDMFRDENVDFAVRLWNAGGRCELHVEPGTVHGFDGLAPDARVSRQAWGRRRAAAARAVAE